MNDFTNIRKTDRIRKFKCIKCNFSWKIQIIIGDRISTGAKDMALNWTDKCPKCESQYFKWENYNE